jgi:hypothetical protein
MPLLNICGVTGNNKTPQIAFACLSGEREEDYTWAIETGFLELCKEYDIPAPKCMITDRELALLNTLDNFFPLSDHILCRWHVNMNVVAKTKKHFKTNEAFQEFYEAWTLVIDSPTIEEYSKNLAALRKFHSAAVKYVEKTWLVWREKLVSNEHPFPVDGAARKEGTSILVVTTPNSRYLSCGPLNRFT